MKRGLAGLLCMMLLLGAQAGLATEAEPPAAGAYGQTMEAAAREAGLEIRTETSFAWGGLPLLDEATDKALGSLLKATRLQKLAQGAEGAGYTALDLILQDVSVLDVSMQVVDGVYYEQSSLTGGVPVAFSAEEFQTFAARMAARTENVLPPDLAWLYALVTSGLTGTEAVQIDPETLDGAMAALAAWETEALAETERLRPKMSIPGLYGLRSTVVDVTREEALALAEAYTDLLAERETLWQEAVRAQLAGEGETEVDETRLTETVQTIAEMLRQLPEVLAEALPEDLAPSELRTVYGPDDVVIAKQLDIFLPDTHIYVEWVPEEIGVPSCYFLLDAELASLELLITREIGAPEEGKKVTKKRDRTIAQMTYIEDAMQLDVVMTRTEDVEARADKEIIRTKTDWMMESEALFGEGAVITVIAETEDTASGEGEGYKRKAETRWQVKGLGFDGKEILKVTAETSALPADPPMDPTQTAVRPGQMEEDAFEAWLADTQVSMMQAGFTVLGRLPSDVAAFILSLQEQP